jgi:hypothetical protein
MPLDPRAKRFLDRLAALRPPSVLSLTVSERRAGVSQLMGFSGPEEPIGSIEERTLPGPSGLPLTLRIYRPAQGRPSGDRAATESAREPPAGVSEGTPTGGEEIPSKDDSLVPPGTGSTWFILFPSHSTRYRRAQAPCNAHPGAATPPESVSQAPATARLEAGSASRVGTRGRLEPELR